MKKLATDSRYMLTAFHGGENNEIDLTTREDSHTPTAAKKNSRMVSYLSLPSR